MILGALHVVIGDVWSQIAFEKKLALLGSFGRELLQYVLFIDFVTFIKHLFMFVI